MEDVLVTETLRAADEFSQVVARANGQDSPELREAREKFLDNPAVKATLPSAADLDAVAAEKAAAAATTPVPVEVKTDGAYPFMGITHAEFQTEIFELRAEIEQLKGLVKSLGALVEGHDADIEGFENRIAAFNQRSTHKL